MGIAKEIFGIELIPLTSDALRNKPEYTIGYVHGEHDTCDIIDDFEISEEAIEKIISKALDDDMDDKEIAKAIKANAKKIFVRRGK